MSVTHGFSYSPVRHSSGWRRGVTLEDGYMLTNDVCDVRDEEVNILLHAINVVATPKLSWAFWPLLGWRIGLLAHGLATYRWMPFLGKEWEQRKIRELVEKDRRDA